MARHRLGKSKGSNGNHGRDGSAGAREAEPILKQRPREIQKFGEMIRMPGRGEAMPGSPSGDLYVKIHVKQDKLFTRDGNNLLTALSIKLTDALLGADYKIQTLDGEAKLPIPQGVKQGELLRIRGRGVPYGRGTRGDLLVRIDIEFPKKLSRAMLPSESTPHTSAPARSTTAAPQREPTSAYCNNSPMARRSVTTA